MGISRKSSRWFRTVRKKFLRSSHQPPTIILVHNNYNMTTASFNSTTEEDSNSTARDEFTRINQVQVGTSTKSKNYDSSDRNHMDVVAAIKIQACFRAHLARRAYRALKSLVKLQAVVRGVCVRRQARIALECMQALVRLQLTVRTRQLLAH